jgi:hypothetical protein
MPENPPQNRRRHPRSVFIYPVAFELFSLKKEPAFYNGNGYLRDISLSGAGLQFEDKYGRFVISEQEDGKINFKDKYGRFEFSEDNVKVNIHLSFFWGENACLFAPVQWIKKVERSFQMKMGVEFIDLENSQLAVIEKLIRFKSKEHHMMWTLWEQYQNHNLMWTLWE